MVIDRVSVAIGRFSVQFSVFGDKALLVVITFTDNSRHELAPVLALQQSVVIILHYE
ncbi:MULTISPECIES: hypothetical protein [unclassified Pseudoalteromonas]|uniref:hypothetical protein n=1 Tax=unclassified Pseudoalteromonas TaxID=194690 RepID=UPI0030151B39